MKRQISKKVQLQRSWDVIFNPVGDGNCQFYCVNTSYPMDNCFTGRRDRSRQTTEKDVLYIIPAGLVSSVHSLGGASILASCPDRVTSVHLFRLARFEVISKF